jgi:hypothetical protein
MRSCSMMRATPGLLVATISFAACSNAAPDDPPAAQAPSAAESRTPQAPPLMPGMGKHHHAIATTSAEAQRYFDQGFNLVFGFNHEEAVRAFRRAADLDAKAPMPHWGIAWARTPTSMSTMTAGNRPMRPSPRHWRCRTVVPRPNARTSRPRPSGFLPMPGRIAPRWRESTRTPCATCRAGIRTISTPPRSMPRAR